MIGTDEGKGCHSMQDMASEFARLRRSICDDLGVGSEEARNRARDSLVAAAKVASRLRKSPERSAPLVETARGMAKVLEQFADAEAAAAAATLRAVCKVPETRRDVDGAVYKFDDFVDYYGAEEAARRWRDSELVGPTSRVYSATQLRIIGSTVPADPEQRRKWLPIVPIDNKRRNKPAKKQQRSEPDKPPLESPKRDDADEPPVHVVKRDDADETEPAKKDDERPDEPVETTIETTSEPPPEDAVQ